MNQHHMQLQNVKVPYKGSEVIIQIPQAKTEVFTRDQKVIRCTQCNNQIQTNVELKIGKGSYFFALLMLPKFLCACILPFFFNSCKDAVHSCPICKAELGRKNFLFE